MTVNREELRDFQSRLEKHGELSNRPSRRPQLAEDDGAASSFNALIHKMSGEPLGESDRLVSELAKIRHTLQVERDRLIREIADFTALNQSAMTAMNIISENLAQYQRTGKLDASRT